MFYFQRGWFNHRLVVFFRTPGVERRLVVARQHCSRILGELQRLLFWGAGVGFLFLSGFCLWIGPPWGVFFFPQAAGQQKTNQWTIVNTSWQVNEKQTSVFFFLLTCGLTYDGPNPQLETSTKIATGKKTVALWYFERFFMHIVSKILRSFC